MKIAIIGTGKVGTHVGDALVKKHQVTYGSRDPAGKKMQNGAQVSGVADSVKEAEVVFLAVPHTAVKETVEKIGAANLAGKTVVDVTNIMDEGNVTVESGAEKIAKLLPDSKVVKAFNAVFAQNMSTGKVGDEKLVLFIAGDDAAAKGKIKQLGDEIGFETVDAGNLAVSKHLENLGRFMIHLGFNVGMGSGIGFRLVKG